MNANPFSHSSIFMHSRGQASIEFVLVLVFMLAIIVSVILPLGEKARFAMEDVAQIGSVSPGLQQFQAGMGRMLSADSNAVQRISIYLPKGSVYTCQPGTNPSSPSSGIQFTLSFHSKIFTPAGDIPPGCADALDGMSCVKSISIPSGIIFRCQGLPSTPQTIEAGESGFLQPFVMGYHATGVSRVLDFNVFSGTG